MPGAPCGQFRRWHCTCSYRIEHMPLPVVKAHCTVRVLRRAFERISSRAHQHGGRCARCFALDAAPTDAVLRPLLPPRKNMCNAHGKIQLKNLRKEELQNWAESIGERPHMGAALFAWMYRRSISDGTLARAGDENVGSVPRLSKSMIRKVQAHAEIGGGLELEEVHRAKDGTQKLVFRCTAGEARGASVETVLIPMVRGRERKPRLTICVSSQVGCAQNCQFCFTGRMGLMGNLSTAQIVEQVVEARRHLAREGNVIPIQNIVAMGMGEPFHNLDAVLAAVDILTVHGGLQFGANKITVSTVGLVPELRRFAAESRAQLAVSLHATTDEVRNWIAPINRKYDLETLLGALTELYPNDKKKPAYGRHVLIEYVMLKGVNDTLQDAHRLSALLADVHCAVNLIVFNPHSGTKFEASEMADVKLFQDVMRASKLCTIRDSRGDDEMAACGQLGSPDQSARLAPILKPPARFREQHGVLRPTAA